MKESCSITRRRMLGVSASLLGSAIVSPLGEVLAGPLFGEEGIVTAELDLTEVARSKFDFDVVGHYARPDVFHFTVTGQPETIIP